MRGDYFNNSRSNLSYVYDTDVEIAKKIIEEMKSISSNKNIIY